jgi:hypothetical protein
MVLRSLLGPHRKMYVNTLTSTTRVQQHQRSTCCSVAQALHQPRRTSRCLSSSLGSSSTTSPTPRVWMPRHVARLVAGPSSTTSPPPRVRVPRHVARLVVDYSASRRLVVDYFAYAARPGASTRHAAHRAASRQLLRLAEARRRLLRPRRASGCLGTSRGSSRGSSRKLVVDYSASRRLVVDYSASRRLVVDYFASAARPGASAHHAARRRLLRLRRASGCLGTSCGSPLVVDYSASRRLVVDYSASRRLVIDYFDSAVRPGASARRAAHHAARRAAHRRLLRLAQARR